MIHNWGIVFSLKLTLIRIAKSKALKDKHVIAMKIKIFILKGPKVMTTTPMLVTNVRDKKTCHQHPEYATNFVSSFIQTGPRPAWLNLAFISLKSKTRFLVSATLQKLSMRWTSWFLSFESLIFFIKVVKTRDSRTFQYQFWAECGPWSRNHSPDPSYLWTSVSQWIPDQRFWNTGCNS